MIQHSKKHFCGECPRYKFYCDQYHCTEDDHIVPHRKCRCIFGKEWFDKNIKIKQN